MIQCSTQVKFPLQLRLLKVDGYFLFLLLFLDAVVDAPPKAETPPNAEPNAAGAEDPKERLDPDVARSRALNPAPPNALLAAGCPNAEPNPVPKPPGAGVVSGGAEKLPNGFDPRPAKAVGAGEAPGKEKLNGEAPMVGAGAAAAAVAAVEAAFETAQLDSSVINFCAIARSLAASARSAAANGSEPW